MGGRTRTFFRPLNCDELIRNNSLKSPVAAAANVRGLYILKMNTRACNLYAYVKSGRLLTKNLPDFSYFRAQK